MRIFLSRFAAAAVALLPLPAFAADDCSLKQIASIPATLLNNSRLLLDATIQGYPVKIQLDTGTEISVISQRFAARAGLSVERGHMTLYGLTGQGVSLQARLGEMRLGNSVSRDALFSVTPLGGDGTTDEPVGFFGADYLQNYDVEVDVAGGKVNLFSQDHCAGKLVYWAPEFFKSNIYFAGSGPSHRPMIDVTVDGIVLHGLLDTGAYSTAMRLAVARDRFDLSPSSPDMEKVGETIGFEGRKIATYQHSFQSMTFGDITLHHPQMVITPIDTGPHEAATGSHIRSNDLNQEDMLIGMSLLRQLHFAISYSEHAIYYTIATPKQAATQ